MSISRIAEQLRPVVCGRVVTHAPLGPYTTFRVGGPADVLVEAEAEEDLQALANVGHGREVAIVGRGSNLLVSDEGFRGIAVRLGRSFRRHAATDAGLTLGGAVYLPAAARLSARLGLAGLEFAAEIPATLGGAVRMNAGAHDRSMSDVLVEAGVIDLASGVRRRVGVGELDYSYRHSSLRDTEIVVEGDVRLDRGEPAEIAGRIADHLRWRREKQPPGRSAGSIFRNPPDDSAGRLIESAGGKGMRVGDAEVSGVHANFIVAGPNARSVDIWTLIWRVHRLVRDRSGIDLEPEVRFLGDFPQDVR